VSTTFIPSLLEHNISLTEIWAEKGANSGMNVIVTIYRIFLVFFFSHGANDSRNLIVSKLNFLAAFVSFIENFYIELRSYQFHIFDKAL